VAISEKELHRFNMALANVMERTRKEKGFSLTQIGVAAGLSQQSVSYIERKLRTPNVDTLFRIATAMDLKLSELIQQAEQEMEHL